MARSAAAVGSHPAVLSSGCLVPKDSMPEEIENPTTARHSEILYIAGLGRSGSTLLDVILGARRLHVSGGELVQVWQHGIVENRICSCGRRFQQCPFWRSVLTYGSSLRDLQLAEEIGCFHRHILRTRTLLYLFSPRGREYLLSRAPPAYASALTTLYASFAAASGASVIVDSSKHPIYLLLLHSFTEFPIRVVHLVRDPRAVAYSWAKLRLEPGDPGGRQMNQYGAVTAALLWDIWNVAARSVATLVDPTHETIRYEDFVTSLSLHLDGVDSSMESNNLLQRSHLISGNPTRFSPSSRLRIDDEWRYSSRFKRGVVSLGTATFASRYRYGPLAR